MADSELLKPPARLFLVEGPTDKQVVRNLRKRFRGERSIPAFDIREMGGVDNLLPDYPRGMVQFRLRARNRC